MRSPFVSSSNTNILQQKQMISLINKKSRMKSLRKQKLLFNALLITFWYVFNDIEDVFNLELEARLSLARFSITFDAWTSILYNPYLAVTTHYINSLPGQPFDWDFKSKILRFEELKGSHSSPNIAAKSLRSLTDIIFVIRSVLFH